MITSDAFVRLLQTLDRLETPYVVSGSAASPIYGIGDPETDVDLVVDLQPDRIDEFVSLLAPDFYADAESIHDVPERQRSFMIIHLATASRIDMSALRKDEYSQASFARRRFEQSRLFSLEPLRVPLATAEDTILRKLEWYRAGGESSERRWNDLRAVVGACGETLDLAYLHHWAEFLKVAF